MQLLTNSVAVRRIVVPNPASQKQQSLRGYGFYIEACSMAVEAVGSCCDVCLAEPVRGCRDVPQRVEAAPVLHNTRTAAGGRIQSKVTIIIFSIDLYIFHSSSPQISIYVIYISKQCTSNA
jgi:hypothetical protein